MRTEQRLITWKEECKGLILNPCGWLSCISLSRCFLSLTALILDVCSAQRKAPEKKRGVASSRIWDNLILSPKSQIPFEPERLNGSRQYRLLVGRPPGDPRYCRLFFFGEVLGLNRKVCALHVEGLSFFKDPLASRPCNRGEVRVLLQGAQDAEGPQHGPSEVHAQRHSSGGTQTCTGSFQHNVLLCPFKQGAFPHWPFPT